jgi:hypothetical protein
MYHAEIKTQQARQIKRGYPFNPAKGLATWKQLAEKDADIARLFPEREVTRIFATEEMPYFERGLETIMSEIATLSAVNGGSPFSHLETVLRRELHNKVPAAQVDQRIQLFLAGKSPIEPVLGENTLRETQILFHGGNPEHPTPESLLGQYLAETGAASIVRTYNTVVTKPPQPGAGPYAQGDLYAQGEAPQGERRLTVAVSAETFPIWQKLFNREEMLTIFGHAQMVQNGKITSYSQAYGDLHAMSAGHILPALILKTTEAQRAEFYMNVVVNREGGGGWGQQEMVPWNVEKFCSIKGGYETCTHWIGNMPIGDKRVNEYSFPGAMDAYAQNQIVDGVNDANKMRPRIATLSPHRGAQNPRLNKLFQAPGYEQLTSVIGQTDSNIRGEWANPGWLITSLIGHTSVDHVPVVFVFADDAKAPIDPKFVPDYETPL